MAVKGSYADVNGKAKPARKPDQVGAGIDAAFRGYINLTLSEGERAGLDTWVAEGSFEPVFNAHVASGINYAVRLDPKSGGFLASATQRDVKSVNAGLCVTARARDALTAVFRCCYTVAILDRTERWEDTQPLADPDRW